jgi:hypothetical protein
VLSKANEVRQKKIGGNMNLGLQCVVKKAENMTEASLKAGSVERNHRSVPLASTKSAALLQPKVPLCCNQKCRFVAAKKCRLLQPQVPPVAATFPLTATSEASCQREHR